jgi:site-specific recombinase XerD
MNGVGLRTVQELAGHASYQTTLRYAHLSASHLAQAVSGLNI